MQAPAYSAVASSSPPAAQMSPAQRQADEQDEQEEEETLLHAAGGPDLEAGSRREEDDCDVCLPSSRFASQRAKMLMVGLVLALVLVGLMLGWVQNQHQQIVPSQEGKQTAGGSRTNTITKTQQEQHQQIDPSQEGKQTAGGSRTDTSTKTQQEQHQQQQPVAPPPPRKHSGAADPSFPDEIAENSSAASDCVAFKSVPCPSLDSHTHTLIGLPRLLEIERTPLDRVVLHKLWGQKLAFPSSNVAAASSSSSCELPSSDFITAGGVKWPRSAYNATLQALQGQSGSSLAWLPSKKIHTGITSDDGGRKPTSSSEARNASGAADAAGGQELGDQGGSILLAGPSGTTVYQFDANTGEILFHFDTLSPEQRGKNSANDRTNGADGTQQQHQQLPPCGVDSAPVRIVSLGTFGDSVFALHTDGFVVMLSSRGTVLSAWNSAARVPRSRGTCYHDPRKQGDAAAAAAAAAATAASSSLSTPSRLRSQVRRYPYAGPHVGPVLHSSMSLSSIGWLFFTDPVNHAVHVFDPAGRFLYEFGLQGCGEGQFDRPSFLFVEGCEVFVREDGNQRIQVLDWYGRHLRFVGPSPKCQCTNNEREQQLQKQSEQPPQIEKKQNPEPTSRCRLTPSPNVLDSLPQDLPWIASQRFGFVVSQGLLYTVNTTRDSPHRFSRRKDRGNVLLFNATTGIYIRPFGSEEGEGDAQYFTTPDALLLSPTTGRLFVSDTGRHRWGLRRNRLQCFEFGPIKTHYRVVMLVLAAHHSHLTFANRIVWQSYMHQNPEVKVFLNYAGSGGKDGSGTESFIWQPYDLVYPHIPENYRPGMIQKTIAAMAYINQTYTFDHFVRTNIGTYWDFDALLNHTAGLPRAPAMLYSGDGPFQNYYVSGTDTIVTQPMISQLLQRQTEVDYMAFEEDQAMGQFFHVRIGAPFYPSRIFFMERYVLRFDLTRRPFYWHG
jgi:outer membrane protein assembly factor BamB